MSCGALVSIPLSALCVMTLSIPFTIFSYSIFKVLLPIDPEGLRSTPGISRSRLFDSPRTLPAPGSCITYVLFLTGDFLLGFDIRLMH